MTCIETLLHEMGFSQEGVCVPELPGRAFVRRRDNFPERAEVVTLQGIASIRTSVDHETDGEIWYHKESSLTYPQTIQGLAEAMAVLEADRARAPREKPIPEWDWAGNSHGVDLIHKGEPVAELLRCGTKENDLTELATRIVAALSGEEDPRIHALKAHLRNLLARCDSLNAEHAIAAVREACL